MTQPDQKWHIHTKHRDVYIEIYLYRLINIYIYMFI